MTAASGSVATGTGEEETKSDQMKQIKENLKRESYQTFDGLKEDDGVFELVNKHTISPSSPSPQPSAVAVSPIIEIPQQQQQQQQQYESSLLQITTVQPPPLFVASIANNNNNSNSPAADRSTASSKFVSTCQIEIKHSLKKNCISPNVKIIKVCCSYIILSNCNKGYNVLRDLLSSLREKNYNRHFWEIIYKI